VVNQFGEKIMTDSDRDGSHGKTVNQGPDADQDEEIRPILPPRGDYQTLLSYQKAEAIFDITFRFAHRYPPARQVSTDQRHDDQQHPDRPARAAAILVGRLQGSWRDCQVATGDSAIRV
jgi:hypothetical protein